MECYEKRKEQLTPELLSHIQRMVLLQMIDSSWKDHLYELDQVRRGIGFRAYAQKDPKIEYQRESFKLFESMMKRIRESTVEYIFKVQVDVRPRAMTGVLQDEALKRVEGGKTGGGFGGGRKKIKAGDIKKIGRNDPCPCGSGKKYKKCCGSNL